MLGEDIGPKILWSGERLPTDDAFFSSLPTSFVIKANHGSGTNYVVKNKEDVEWDKIVDLANSWLKRDYSALSAEWQYRWIPRRLMIEEHIDPDAQQTPANYKFYCFNGEVQLLLIVEESGDERVVCYFDRECNPLKISKSNATVSAMPTGIRTPDKITFHKMRSIADKLSQGFQFCRVDLYHTDRPYFGEMTFSPNAGVERYSPSYVDGILYRLLEKPCHTQAVAELQALRHASPQRT
ncbi:hypothetical protein J2T57_004315 [Natronocella acetinitrilica]|uniref:ATP-grasp domain-containing protein n=1 Tax=Natronocella acetinitrilica TaxID=414046 RepID=A0AAE3G965_9GAMM|nr:hypothetical protein [Natronocella acetinitrilica]